MRKKPLLQLRKCMANKSFVFFTGVLSLCALGNAYGRDAEISIINLIPPHHVYYSKNGYKIEAMGKGHCMIGVYSPPSHNALYGRGYGQIGIHFQSSGKCWDDESTQKFKVTNNDTGKLVGTFEWIKHAGVDPYLHNVDNIPFMLDSTHFPSDMKNMLNFRIGHHKG